MRIISRVDIKNNFVIKGIQMEGLRKIGDPFNILKKYFDQGADEIILIDIVASLYRRNNLFDVVERAAKEIFVPMTLGGGIKNLEDIQRILKYLVKGKFDPSAWLNGQELKHSLDKLIDEHKEYMEHMKHHH